MEISHQGRKEHDRDTDPTGSEIDQQRWFDKLATAFTLSLSLGCAGTEEISERQVEQQIRAEVRQQINEKWDELREDAARGAQWYARENLPAIYRADREIIAQAVMDDLIAREFLAISPERIREVIADLDPDPEFLRIKQMKESTVRLKVKDETGSGVIIYSGPDAEGKYLSVVLTCNHVVDAALTDETLLNKGIETTIYRNGGTETVYADIISVRENNDLALLTIREERPIPDPTPCFLPHDKLGCIREGTKIATYGAQLGVEPFLSDGAITIMNHHKNGRSFNMVSAPTYMGNSGAGIWHFIPVGEEKVPLGFYVGTYSMIYTNGIRSTPVPHMGLSVPPEKVYDFLAESGLVPDAETLSLKSLDPSLLRISRAENPPADKTPPAHETSDDIETR